MSSIDNISQQDVRNTFRLYPPHIQAKLLYLWQLIYEVASENNEIGEIEETLKWSEPSYLAKSGSTIRIAWKKSSPDDYAIYFNCKTNLIDTFKEIYKDTFRYEGNRAIVFNVSQPIPFAQLKHCILLSLTYHKIKHRPLLGA